MWNYKCGNNDDGGCGGHVFLGCCCFLTSEDLFVVLKIPLQASHVLRGLDFLQ